MSDFYFICFDDNYINLASNILTAIYGKQNMLYNVKKHQIQEKETQIN